MGLQPTTPHYTLQEASLLTRLPLSTLTYWARGRSGVAQPLIRTDRRLSFVNLVELHMVGMFRDEHGLPLQRIRRAVEQLRLRHPQEQHPLARMEFWTDGRDILEKSVEGAFVDLNEPGQLTFREVIECYAHRVQWEGQMPMRLYPWTVNAFSAISIKDVRRSIVVDPAVAFGQAVVVDTRVTTHAIKDMWDVGMSVQEIAEEFDLKPEQVEDAIRIEEPPRSRRAA